MVSSPPMTVSRWSSAEHPFLFEINTWAWLEGLSADANRRIDLGSVPEARWDVIAERGFDAVWLMGVCAVGARERYPLPRGDCYQHIT